MSETTLGGEALAEVYRDLHAHPELSFAETRTAELVAAHLRAFGFEVTTGVGRTGVVGMINNGPGPMALLRADMDALPMEERTGLPYASQARGVDSDGREGPVMHSCGHDVHVACLLGAAGTLAADRSTWSGSLMVLFQPAEEQGAGAQEMIDDGLFDRFGEPDVVLGQHVAPMPAGTVALTSGVAFAAADSMKIMMFGRGGHGSRPEVTIDPVVMACATVMRLQTVISRELASNEQAVVTVGAIRSGTKENIIPDEAELLLSMRSFDPAVRERIIASIKRIAKAEALASGATREPEFTVLHSFPAVVNDPTAAARMRSVFENLPGQRGPVLDPGPVSGSEDVGLLALAAGAPCVFWLLGGADPQLFADVGSEAEFMAVVAGLPSNHSPLFAPVIEPTLSTGVAALVAAAQAWLPAAATVMAAAADQACGRQAVG